MADRLWMVTRNGVHSCHIVGLFAIPEEAVRVALGEIENAHDGYHDYRIVAIDVGVTREHEDVGAELELTREDEYGRKLKTNSIKAKLYCLPGESAVARYLPPDLEARKEEYPPW